MTLIRNALAGLLLALAVCLIAWGARPADHSTLHLVSAVPSESIEVSAIASAIAPIEKDHQIPDRRPRSWIWLALAVGVAGVTVTYNYPVAGATAPTAAQSKKKNLVTAQVNFADADTTATVTHNFGFSLADGTLLFPVVLLTQESNGTLAAVLSVTMPPATGNAVVLTKAAATGSGGTWTVTILRPHTIMR